MGLLTSHILIPSLKDPEAAYYSSGKGYPAQQRAAGEAIAVELITVGPGSVDSSLAAPGEIVAQEQIDIRPAVAGLIKQVHVQPGEQVEAGTLLLELESQPLQNDVKIARLNWETAQANLTAVESSSRASLAQLTSRITHTQQQLKTAEERYQQLLAMGQFQQQLSLSALQTRLDAAKTRLTSMETLAAQGAVSQLQLQDAQVQLAQVQQEFQLAQSGSLSTQQTLHGAESSVTGHRQALAKARQALNRAESLEQIRQTKARLTVKNRQVLLEKAQQALDQIFIRATDAGLISAVNVDRGELVTPDGDQPALQLETDLVFQAYIDQTRLGDIQIGDTATVQLMDRNGQPLPGQVVQINPAIETEDFIPGRVGVDRQYTYSVWVQLPAENLSPGLQGHVTFQQTETAVLVPESAVVHLSAGEAMVMVAEAGEATVRPVRLGPLQDNQRQIVSGLSSGEQIVANPNGLRPGDNIRPLTSSRLYPGTRLTQSITGSQNC